MKLGKKIATLALSLAMVAVSASTVFASPKEDIVKALKDAKVPKTYVIQAENYMKTNDISTESAEIIKTQVEKVDSILKEADLEDVSKLGKEDVEEVMKAVKTAGDSIGLNIDVKKNAGGSVSFVAKDKEGQVVADFTTTEVKQTGVNNTVLALGGFVLLLSVGSFFVIRRKVTA